ncbi:MAG: hypothetical protein HYV14_16095 [Elusimicrobia bacterium]|nr:hypothetical protein [Elusimicrobiota bacterium]
MSRSRRAVVLPSAALLAAFLALTAAAAGAGTDLENPSTADIRVLRAKIVLGNDLPAAESFLGDVRAQETVKAGDPAAYLEVFARATELADPKGVLGGESSVHSIRQSLSKRMDCAFCLDGVLFPAWARKNLPGIGERTLASLGEVLWNWDKLSARQKAWAVARKQDAGWAKLPFKARHETMRAWALAERDAMMKLNPADAAAAADFYARVYEVSEALSSHEMSGLWKRSEEITQAASSLAEARARVAMSSDPRQKALLAEALSAPTTEARLAALAKIFENYGERPASLLAAAPPRDDQKFDADSRKLVASMLKSALLKETEGTFAGDDLKAFYARVPLEVTFTTTSMSALGWYHHGGDTLYFNERYVEEYVKTHGATIETLKRDPALLQNLARIFASTFVHEAQHHRQDVWARENKMPRLYHQGDEVEAFQTDALFMMQKLRVDKKFAAWAEKEAETSSVVRGDLSYAKRMESEGPGYFDRTIPNAHYPETLSKEGGAWCAILWHNSVAKPLEAELERRAALPEAARKRLEAGAPALKASYKTYAAFQADVLKASSVTIEGYVKDERERAANAAKHYNALRGRQEAVAATTRERYNILEPRDGVRTERGIDAVPMPFGLDKE